MTTPEQQDNFDFYRSIAAKYNWPNVKEHVDGRDADNPRFFMNTWSKNREEMVNAEIQGHKPHQGATMQLYVLRDFEGMPPESELDTVTKRLELYGIAGGERKNSRTTSTTHRRLSQTYNIPCESFDELERIVAVVTQAIQVEAEGIFLSHRIPKPKPI